MRPAKRDGELVADLAPKRSRLGKFQMVGVRGSLFADKASLAANERKMLLAPFSRRLLWTGKAGPRLRDRPLEGSAGCQGVV